MNTRTFNEIKNFLQEFIGIKKEVIKPDTSIFDLGIDSVMMTSFIFEINKKFGVSMKLSDVIFKYNNIELMCSYLDENPREIITSEKVENKKAETSEYKNDHILVKEKDISVNYEQCRDGNIDNYVNFLGEIINGQNEMMEKMFTKQLEFLDGFKTKTIEKSSDLTSKQKQKTSDLTPKQKQKTSDCRGDKRQVIPEINLSKQQKGFLEGLIVKLCEKTSKSKDMVQKYRLCLADLDEIAGFTMLLKELHYIITDEYGKDSYIYDLNGNKYIDIAMGFGTLIMGHSPQFVMQAIQDEVKRGMQLGARHRLVGEVAELICELTKFDRATFTATGTEAVMTAMKIARAYTGKKKIVIFTNAYHGHNDSTLVSKFKMESCNSPIAPGIDIQASNEIIILEYNNIENIGRILEYDDIAAVLIEPVQSRFPECKPINFLRELRKVTNENGILLIFDEIITGFRCNIGGAKALFNIEPDLATYGKAIGNGMPIGVVVGKRPIMDVVDGGQWQYNDNSYPVVDRTFFAGTFFKHPFSIAATHAILNHYKTNGNTMLESINKKTEYMVSELNSIFELYNVPIVVHNFTSLFMFKPKYDNPYMDIFFYVLLDEGVYTWEGRTCFISSAHTDEDIRGIIDAVKRTLERMVNGGFYNSNNIIAFSKGVPDETYYE